MCRLNLAEAGDVEVLVAIKNSFGIVLKLKPT